MAHADLGPWRGAKLGETVAAYGGVGADDDLPDALRFARGVGKLIVKRRRLAGATMRTDAISVFILRPEGSPGSDAVREPLLGDGGIEVAGRIWFVGATAQSGRFIEPPSTSDGDVFDYVEAIGCGNYPAVVFNPTVQPPTLRFYQKGLAAEHDVEVIEITNMAVTVERVEAILDRMWQNSFRTPDAQIDKGSGVWADPAKYWAKSEAEKIVQSHIKTALAVALVDCVIRHEQSMGRGRVDIEIEQPTDDDPPRWIRPMEIEVKVLRERGSTGRKRTEPSVHRWIGHGIRQAAAYRDERGAEHGMLCCIDMRANDLEENFCPATTKQRAADHNVVMFRRFLYNSADALRLTEYGGDEDR
jgi:hypothetical protein